MKRIALAIAAACTIALAITGCGGHTTSKPAPKISQHLAFTAAAACPPGGGTMGCAARANAIEQPHIPSVVAPATGCVFPDVSSYQGHPDWAAAASHICAAVAKAGEGGFIVDPDFAWNVAQLRALHIPWSAYYFVRGCNEGPAFVSALNQVGFRGDRDALRPVLDMEVPSAFGCAVPLADAVHHAFGVWPIIYTAPGTWPGGPSGGLNAWEADYGSFLAPLPFNATVLAWQRYSPPFTDYWLPGLGTGDVSIDLHGFSRQFAFPAPPDPYAIFPSHAYLLGGRRISERAAIERWDRRGCKNPVRRLVCRVDRSELVLLRERLWTLAHHGNVGVWGTPVNWTRFHWGKRFQAIQHRLTKHR